MSLPGSELLNGEKRNFKPVTKSPAWIKHLCNYIWAASLPNLDFFSHRIFTTEYKKKIKIHEVPLKEVNS